MARTVIPDTIPDTARDVYDDKTPADSTTITTVDPRFLQAATDFANKEKSANASATKNTDNTTSGSTKEAEGHTPKYGGAGTVPDILITSRLQFFADYESTGLFADLYPYIDADPELDRGIFVQSVLHAVERDGKLYQAFPSFAINTVVGSPQILGSESGWDLENFAEVMGQNPDAIFPMGYSVSKMDFLREMLRCNADEFIDRDAGTVSFESEDFIKLLEICNRFPADADVSNERNDADAIAAGQQIMAQTSVYTFNEIQTSRALGIVWQDGEYVFKGYPAALKDGHSVRIYDGLGIIESSPNKDAAWSFVRMVLNPDFQNDNNILAGFPFAQAALDRMYKNTLDGMYSYSLGITNPDGSFASIELDAPEPEDVEIIYNLINSVTPGASRSIEDTLLDIITGIASEYFAGTRSIEDVVSDIQSRTAIYVAEQS